LGTTLRLPPWLEEQRGVISGALRPLTVEPWVNPAGSAE
jgi:hypothetical protein